MAIAVPIKNAIESAVRRAELTGAKVVGFVLTLKFEDGNFANNAQNVTPAEFVAVAKELEKGGKGGAEIYKDKDLRG